MDRRRFLDTMAGLPTSAIVGRFSMAATAAAPPSSNLPRRVNVLQILRRVDDRWIGSHPNPGPNDWARATYFSGNMALHRLVGEQRYLDYATAWAESHGYGLIGGASTRNAD